MRLLALLLCLSAFPVAAQSTLPGDPIPPHVDVRWLNTTTAELAWDGGTGPGSCVWRMRPYHPTYHQEPTCGRDSGVMFLGNDAMVGDRYELRSTDGVTVLASATLGEAPAYDMILPVVVAP